ncbi:SDR family oxidoreductase [Microbulbifer rhizosphaerae]|uniref:NAD(P)H dehydrogenase (Quinone) n=1 Tax=Microbulbifer rhizosphaerae TaxID=1562603 RepID=A0A7W4Z6Y4_9GAMM|nr:SDR family oxidoreductase [Microbulbifer rhizosphaerae]MBB3059203.1 NAD(P)H dehydrogenase (quinone) [Microbulbifer rhizosphaerae]
MIVVTGASGQLGRLVIAELLKSVPAAELVAAVRNPDSVADLAAQGVEVRKADYNEPATLKAAFEGANKVLLISSSEVGQRAPQHANVIEAAKKAEVGLLVYTSILHADTTPLPLGLEHRQTEAKLAGSGLPHAILRNGWYSENYTAGVPVALQFGAVMGCAGDGRISSASRADYAAAAAAVLLAEEQAGKVYELAGDDFYTLGEFAAEIAAQSGKAISYQDLPEAEYQQALVGAGLPEPIATLLAESDTGASKGGLFDDSKQLSALIGRPTTPMVESIQLALASLG